MKKIILLICLSIATTVLFGQDIDQAITEGNVTLVKELIAKDATLLNAKNQAALTPLNLAAEHGQVEVVALLLQLGADPYIGDNENSMPMHLAAISGSIEIVEMLRDKGVDIDIPDDNGMTALLFAMSRRQIAMSNYLLGLGADPKVQTANGFTPIQMAAMSGNLDLVKLIVEKKADVNVCVESGVTPLHSALSYGHTEIVKYLIEQGAKIDAENEIGDQPLAYARNPNTYDAALYLIKLKADPNHKNRFNQTALHHIAGRGTATNVAKLLLDHGANINTLTLTGMTPLTFASFSPGADGMSKFLILNGAAVNPEPCKHDKACTCGPQFQTPLHAAVRHGQNEMAINLVSNGARVNVFDDQGLTPLHMAVMNGDAEIVEYLLDHGAFINTKEENHGSTELHLAIAMGYEDIAGLLIKNGSNLNIPDDEGKTPLDYALYYNHKPLAYDLLAAGANDTNLKDYLNEPNPLDEPIVFGEAKVWFLGHSGWAVKTQNHFLVFDYFCNTWDRKPDDSCLASGCIIPEQLKDQNVTVFSTHSHGDHYDPRIFTWKETIPDIEYVLCWEQNTDGNEYTYIPVHGEQKVEDMNVYVHYSTDLGGGYLIDVDGLTILHMGDHANGEDELMAAFTDEIDLIAEKNREIDIVFGGIRGCSLGRPEQVKQGIYYTLETLQPKLFVPMHNGAHTFNYQIFAETAKEDGYEQEMKAVFHKGDRFVYRKDGGVETVAF